jgi:hypothetical protein
MLLTVANPFMKSKDCAFEEYQDLATKNSANSEGTTRILEKRLRFSALLVPWTVSMHFVESEDESARLGDRKVLHVTGQPGS